MIKETGHFRSGRCRLGELSLEDGRGAGWTVEALIHVLHIAGEAGKLCEQRRREGIDEFTKVLL